MQGRGREDAMWLLVAVTLCTLVSSKANVAHAAEPMEDLGESMRASSEASIKAEVTPTDTGKKGDMQKLTYLEGAEVVSKNPRAINAPMEIKEAAAKTERTYMAQHKYIADKRDEKYQKEVDKVRVSRMADHMTEQKKKRAVKEEVANKKAVKLRDIADKAKRKATELNDKEKAIQETDALTTDREKRAGIALKQATEKVEKLKEGPGRNAVADEHAATSMLAEMRISEAYATGALPAMGPEVAKDDCLQPLMDAVELATGEPTAQHVKAAKDEFARTEDCRKNAKAGAVNKMNDDTAEQMEDEARQKHNGMLKMKTEHEIAMGIQEEKSIKMWIRNKKDIEKPNKATAERDDKNAKQELIAKWYARQTDTTKEMKSKGEFKLQSMKEAEVESKEGHTKLLDIRQRICDHLSKQQVHALENRAKGLAAFSKSRKDLIVAQKAMDAVVPYDPATEAAVYLNRGQECPNIARDADKIVNTARNSNKEDCKKKCTAEQAKCGGFFIYEDSAKTCRMYKPGSTFGDEISHSPKCYKYVKGSGAGSTPDGRRDLREARELREANSGLVEDLDKRNQDLVSTLTAQEGIPAPKVAPPLPPVSTKIVRAEDGALDQDNQKLSHFFDDEHDEKHDEEYLAWEKTQKVAVSRRKLLQSTLAIAADKTFDAAGNKLASAGKATINCVTDPAKCAKAVLGESASFNVKAQKAEREKENKRDKETAEKMTPNAGLQFEQETKELVDKESKNVEKNKKKKEEEAEIEERDMKIENQHARLNEEAEKRKAQQASLNIELKTKKKLQEAVRVMKNKQEKVEELNSKVADRDTQARRCEQGHFRRRRTCACDDMPAAVQKAAGGVRNHGTELLGESAMWVFNGFGIFHDPLDDRVTVLTDGPYKGRRLGEVVAGFIASAQNTSLGESISDKLHTGGHGDGRIKEDTRPGGTFGAMVAAGPMAAANAISDAREREAKREAAKALAGQSATEKKAQEATEKANSAQAPERNEKLSRRRGDNWERRRYVRRRAKPKGPGIGSRRRYDFPEPPPPARVPSAVCPCPKQKDKPDTVSKSAGEGEEKSPDEESMLLKDLRHLFTQWM